MPAAIPIIAGAAFGALAPTLAAAVSVAGIASLTAGAVIGGALLGAAAGALPILLNSLFGKDAPAPVATGRIQDETITIFSRVSRVPLVYGARSIGANVIHLGKAEFKDVTITSTGRSESHLFADVLLGLSEGRCREVTAFYIGDTPQRVGTYRFQPGSSANLAIPELTELAPPGRNYPYIHTALLFFSGDLGFVSNIPDFKIDLRGIYPNVVVAGSKTVTWSPLRASLDGPSNTLVIIPDPDTIDTPSGVITYRVPWTPGPPGITHTQPPTAITGNVTQAFYFGLINALVMVDPDNPRMYYQGRPGLARSSAEWLPLDMGEAFANPILQGFRDDRTCRTHTIHEHEDGWFYAMIVSWATGDREQIVLPDGGFTTLRTGTFRPEDNSYYMVVSGGGPDRLMSYNLTSGEWRELAQISATQLVSIVKMGVLVFAFYAGSCTQIDCATGEVIEGLPLGDFMAESDANALGANPVCRGVGVSRHRYSSTGVFYSEDLEDWRISVFHEPRADGEAFPRPAPFRRWCIAKATAGTYTQKPGFPTTPPPIGDVVWISNDIAQASKTAADMIADGADFKTTTPTTEEPEYMRPVDIGSYTLGRVHVFGAPTFWEALNEVVPNDATDYVRMQHNSLSIPTTLYVKLSVPTTPDPGDDHIVSVTFRSQDLVAFDAHIKFEVVKIDPFETLIATSGEIPHRNGDVDQWIGAELRLSPSEIAALGDYEEVYIKATVEIEAPFAGIFVGYDWTQAEMKIGGLVVETLGEGYQAFSYYPVHQNRHEERRVIFIKDTGDGLDWYFTVKGGPSCADRDFAHAEFVSVENMTATILDDFHTQLTDARRSDEDDFYVGYWMGEEGLAPRVLAYDASTGILQHEDNGGFSGPAFIDMLGPRWTLKHWSLKTPVQLSVPGEPGQSTENPPHFLEGRYVGHGWTRPATIAEIISDLRDDGYPGDPIDIPYVQHPGTFTLTGLLYYRCGPAGANRCEPAPSPVVPDLPLKQFRLDTAPFPEVFVNTAAALGEASLVDYMLEWTDHNIDGGACASFSLTRDCFGIDSTGAIVTVAADCSVASWEATKMVIVQDEKAKWTEMSVSNSGYRHDWFEGRTTPAAIRMDCLTNTRYGGRVTIDRINVAAHLAQHGYSLEQISVDGERIRRFIWNVVIAEAQSLADIDELLLAPAGAKAFTEDGRYSIAFETAGVEPVIEFDESMIRPGSFVTSIRSPNTAVNRCVIRFYNAIDQREDRIAYNDEDNQQSTGSIREREIEVSVCTDLRRCFYLARQGVERASTDRMVVNYITGTFARMLLNPGDPVRVSDPIGKFRRKAFRVLSLEDDAGEEVRLEGEAISPFTTDDRVVEGIRRSNDTDAQGAGSFATAAARDRSMERFAGIALAPMRVAAVMRDDGTALLLANRAPNSRAVAGVRARLANADQQAGFDGLPVCTPRSMAILDDLTDSEVTMAFRGLIDVAAAISLPADAYLVKRTSAAAEPETLEPVRVTAYGASHVLDPESEGTVSFTRGAAGLVTADLRDADAVYEITADADSDLEPQRYDGEPSPAQTWRNPGDAVDRTSDWKRAVANDYPAFTVKGDFLLIGWNGGGGWLPNVVRVELDTPSTIDQRLVIEYSCVPDPRLPLRVWKPLGVLDGTKGFTQSGRIHFEIPPDWQAADAWDQHGNKAGDGLARYYIRIQRRQRQGSGVRVSWVAFENLPVLLMVPPGPTTARLPELTQGQPAQFRFAGRSTFPADEDARLPVCSVASTGSRWKLLEVAYPRVVTPADLEFDSGDSYDPPAGAAVEIEWEYTSASHGFGAAAFGQTVLGVGDDPHLKGAVVTVRRQSDGQVMREEKLSLPLNTWTYLWSDRESDGTIGLDVEIRQYDDRGFLGPATILSLERPGAS